MSWHFSRALEAASWALNSSAGDRLGTSSGMKSVKKDCLRGSTMDTLNEPQSLLTCVSSHSPVRLSSIEDLRMWLAQDSHANHSASLENKQPETTSETCGLQRGMSFASYSQYPFCLKTSKDLFPTARLHALPRFHLQPINLLVSQESDNED